MNNPIYQPKGAALEYADLALNIYTECPHGCWYCYAKQMAKRFGREWTGNVKPRDRILEAVKKQLASGKIKNKTIHLCFTCDPYPREHDTSVTRQIVKLIKDSGNNVQILTKNVADVRRDIDLLDYKDWVGTTITGEPNKHYFEQNNLFRLMDFIPKTKIWISCEPVLHVENVMYRLKGIPYDKAYVGALTGHKTAIDYKLFALRVLELNNKRIILKESLKKEINR
jgi:protein gp37